MMSLRIITGHVVITIMTQFHRNRTVRFEPMGKILCNMKFPFNVRQYIYKAIDFIVNYQKFSICQ